MTHEFITLTFTLMWNFMDLKVPAISKYFTNISKLIWLQFNSQAEAADFFKKKTNVLQSYVLYFFETCSKRMKW